MKCPKTRIKTSFDNLTHFNLFLKKFYLFVAIKSMIDVTYIIIVMLKLYIEDRAVIIMRVEFTMSRVLEQYNRWFFYEWDWIFERFAYGTNAVSLVFGVIKDIRGVSCSVISMCELIKCF